MRGARIVIARTKTKQYAGALQPKATRKPRDPRSPVVGIVIFFRVPEVLKTHRRDGI